MCYTTNSMMFVGELSVLVMFLGFIQQCSGKSSSALDSFLQGVLRVQQTLPQRSRRNVVKRPGVSLEHEDLQELHGVNADIENQAQLYTGLDEASILRELEQVSGSANLSKRHSEDHVLSVAYKKAKLHAESSKGMRKNKEPPLLQIVRDKGNAGLLTENNVQKEPNGTADNPSIDISTENSTPTIKEIEIVIKNLKNGKATGIDDLTAELLKYGMQQFPVYNSRKVKSRYKVGDNYGLKNKLADTGYGEVTFVKLQYLPKYKFVQTTENVANSANDVGHVKIISNRRENLDGNYEMHSDKGEVDDHFNTIAPYEKINDVFSKPLVNEKQFGDSFLEDSISSSQQITGAPEIQNAVNRIQSLNNYGSPIEESWETNNQKLADEEEEPESVKQKDDSIRPGYSNYLNRFNNDKDYNNIQTNYEDNEQSRQKIDISESKPPKVELWHDIHLHETDSESSMVDPYKNLVLQDTKISDNENLRNPMDGVTMPVKYNSLSFVSLIENSRGARPTPKSVYLNSKSNAYRHSDTGKLVNKGHSQRNFISRHPFRDSIAKDRVLNVENMIAHKKRLQKNDIIDDNVEIFSNYPESKETIRSQFLHDSRRKFVGKDPEILSVHEADLKYQGGYEHTLADLINGELVTDIVRSIMNKVISDVNLRQHIASGFGAATKAKASRATKLAPTAEEMYCASRCTVERRADRDAMYNGIPQSKCLALPSELKEFLKWMLEDAKEDVHSENKNLLMVDQLVFYSDFIRQTLTTDVPPVQNKTYDPTLKKKMKLVLQLLAEYEQLNDDEKDTVSKVHHYLEEELERLQGEPNQASNRTTVRDLDLTTSSPPSEPVENFTYMEPEPVQDTSAVSDLIKKQLDMLGLGQNAKLGQRLSDRFQYSTPQTLDISPMPQEPVPLPPLIDNYDSVF